MPEAELPRVVIEHVWPTVDGGRFPVKRVVGDTLRVGANIFKDGHDLIGAALIYRLGEKGEWHRAPMSHDRHEDRWYAEATLPDVGHYQYAVEAWPARYITWSEDILKRFEAGQTDDVKVELVAGAQLIEAGAEHLPSGPGKVALGIAKKLRDQRLELGERVAIGRGDEIRAIMSGPILPEEATRTPLLECVVDRKVAAFASWYELFPRSQGTDPAKHGTFADTEGRLPELAELGFDVLYLPPIHPIGKVNRKGRNNTLTPGPEDVGSPWAIGSDEGGHTDVHPQLGSLDDFKRFVKKARDVGIEVALDYALQCAPDHPWVKAHPDWFNVRSDGTIRYAENPPKKYQDIYPLNFWCEDRENLWKACRDILLFWVDAGVTTFRVDNPHTKPFAFWEWVIAEVQQKHPGTVFLAEAFTTPKRMDGLAKLGFTQSYSHFTWKNSSWELKDFMANVCEAAHVEYFRPNLFANTPDILHAYLQTGGRPAFRVRLILAGTLAPVYGIYSGYELCENVPVHEGSEEYLDSEKYEVRVRDWDAPGNIKADVGLINRIRRNEPALQRLDNLTFIHSENDQILAYLKRAPGSCLLVVVNLDPHHGHESNLHLPLDLLGIGPDEGFEVEDLLTGSRYGWRGGVAYVRLDPSDKVGHILRLPAR